MKSKVNSSLSNSSRFKSHSVSRRSFLAQASLAAAALAGCNKASYTDISGSPAKNGFEIFAPDWTLERSCNPAVFEFAKRIGLDGVQVDFARPPKPGDTLPLFDKAMQDKLMAASSDHSVKIVSLAMAALNRIPYYSVPETEQWVIDSIGVAQRMKLQVVLLPFFNLADIRGDEAGITELIRRLKRVAPIAEEAGVVFGIESWLTAAELERILDAVNSPAVQVYYDIGNMQKVGENVTTAIRYLGGERICEVHLKDYDDLYGKGSMDFPAVRSALDDIGYRGWVGIEGKPMPLGLEESVRYNVEYLRTIFPPELT